MDIYKILDTLKTLDENHKFAGQAAGQKPGDQVRGTEKATSKKSGEHPFKGRLVGASEGVEQEIREGWESYLAEYGATATSAAGTANADDKEDPATQAAEIKNTQDALNNYIKNNISKIVNNEIKAYFSADGNIITIP